MQRIKTFFVLLFVTIFFPLITNAFDPFSGDWCVFGCDTPLPPDFVPPEQNNDVNPFGSAQQDMANEANNIYYFDNSSPATAEPGYWNPSWDYDPQYAPSSSSDNNIFGPTQNDIQNEANSVHKFDDINPFGGVGDQPYGPELPPNFVQPEEKKPALWEDPGKWILNTISDLTSSKFADDKTAIEQAAKEKGSTGVNFNIGNLCIGFGCNSVTLTDEEKQKATEILTAISEQRPILTPSNFSENAKIDSPYPSMTLSECAAAGGKIVGRDQYSVTEGCIPCMLAKADNATAIKMLKTVIIPSLQGGIENKKIEQGGILGTLTSGFIYGPQRKEAVESAQTELAFLQSLLSDMETTGLPLDKIIDAYRSIANSSDGDKYFAEKKDSIIAQLNKITKDDSQNGITWNDTLYPQIFLQKLSKYTEDPKFKEDVFYELDNKQNILKLFESSLTKSLLDYSTAMDEQKRAEGLASLLMQIGDLQQSQNDKVTYYDLARQAVAKYPDSTYVAQAEVKIGDYYSNAAVYDLYKQLSPEQQKTIGSMDAMTMTNAKRDEILRIAKETLDPNILDAVALEAGIAIKAAKIVEVGKVAVSAARETAGLATKIGVVDAVKTMIAGGEISSDSVLKGATRLIKDGNPDLALSFLKENGVNERDANRFFELLNLQNSGTKSGVVTTWFDTKTGEMLEKPLSYISTFDPAKIETEIKNLAERMTAQIKNPNSFAYSLRTDQSAIIPALTSGNISAVDANSNSLVGKNYIQYLYDNPEKLQITAQQIFNRLGIDYNVKLELFSDEESGLWGSAGRNFSLNGSQTPETIKFTISPDETTVLKMNTTIRNTDDFFSTLFHESSHVEDELVMKDSPLYAEIISVPGENKDNIRALRGPAEIMSSNEGARINMKLDTSPENAQLFQDLTERVQASLNHRTSALFPGEGSTIYTDQDLYMLRPSEIKARLVEYALTPGGFSSGMRGFQPGDIKLIENTLSKLTDEGKNLNPNTPYYQYLNMEK